MVEVTMTKYPYIKPGPAIYIVPELHRANWIFDLFNRVQAAIKNHE